MHGWRYRTTAPILSIALPLMMWAAGAVAGTWQVRVIDEDGDAGKYCELQIDSLGTLYAVYFRDDLDMLMTVTGLDTTWLTPQKIDSTGSVGGHCAIAVTSTGVRRVSYQWGDTKSLLYAGPEAVDIWERGTVVASPDNVGEYVSALAQADGEVSVSCSDATNESLLFMVRDSFGVWSAPQTIDPGPGRGTHGDHVYRPGAGYAFSEYDDANGSLLFADPLIHSRSWAIGTIREQGDAGAFVSSCSAPDNRVASAFYYFNEAVLGCVYISALHGGGGSVVKAVVDSIAESAASDVFIDVAVTPDWDWHISYRNARDHILYYAYAADYILVGIGEDDDTPFTPGAALRLDQNAPNPFNPRTRITYAIPSDGHVHLAVYDVSGRHIGTLVDESKRAGAHTVTWNGRSESGGRVASGVYFLRLSFGGDVRTKKLVLLR